MSDSWLQYIPKEPEFRPSVAAAAEAAAKLAAFFPEAASVKSEFKDAVTFFHPGGNWSGVQCPVCGSDAEAWWGDAMERAEQGQFLNLVCVAPCCGSTVSLNQLKYIWPAAFGSYVLEAMNPNAEGLPLAQMEQLEAILDCELVEIPLHL